MIETEDKQELLNIVKTNLELLFNDIEFISYNHTYKYSPENVLFPSVSKLYKEFEIPFDDKIADFIAPKMGLTGNELREIWKQKGKASADKGTEVHKFAEDYANSLYPKDYVPEDNAKKGVIEFFNDNPDYIVISQELVLYHKKYKYAGTTDLILYDVVREIFILADWKTNDDLHKNYKNKKLLFPFQDVLDTPLNKYKIQLNLYEMCLEEKGFPIEEKLIIWLTKDETCNKNYKLYQVEDLKPKLKEYYDTNS